MNYLTNVIRNLTLYTNDFNTLTLQTRHINEARYHGTNCGLAYQLVPLDTL